MWLVILYIMMYRFKKSSIMYWVENTRSKTKPKIHNYLLGLKFFYPKEAESIRIDSIHTRFKKYEYPKL